MKDNPINYKKCKKCGYFFYGYKKEQICMSCLIKENNTERRKEKK